MDEFNPRPGKPIRMSGAVLAVLGAGTLALAATDTGLIVGVAALSLGVLLLGIGWIRD